ncbi:MAG: anti-sigma factor [Deferribacterales bacterium]|jgi:predicted anti-sigma-YlaC factor YlaD
MDCTKFHELISLYIDEETNSVQTQALEKHMETCGGCRSALTNQLKLRDMVKESFSKTSEIDLSMSIMSKLSVPSSAKKPSIMKKLSVYAAAAAAVCIIAMAAMMSLHVDNNKVAGNEKLEEYVIEHVGTGQTDFRGELETVNAE